MQCPLCSGLIQEREEVVGHGEQIRVISCSLCQTEFKRDDNGNLITMARFAEALLRDGHHRGPRPEQQCPRCQRWVQDLPQHRQKNTKCQALIG